MNVNELIKALEGLDQTLTVYGSGAKAIVGVISIEGTPKIGYFGPYFAVYDGGKEGAKRGVFFLTRDENEDGQGIETIY